jgi:hypothetical protein
VSDTLSFQELESAAKPLKTTAPAATTEETTKPAATVEETKPQFTEADVTAYQKMSDLGINPENAQEFIQAKKSLEALPAVLADNPDALMDEIQKNNPELHRRLLDKISDRWYNQVGKYEYEKQKNGGVSRTTPSEPANDPRVAQMQARLEALETERKTERESKRNAEISVSYNSALDNLVGKLKEKNSALTDDRLDYIRLKTEKLAWADPQARQRISQGVFTDVPKYFAEATNRVTAETKTAAEKEHEARKGVEERGGKTIIPGAEAVAGTSKPSGLGSDPIWGDISAQEIASAYKK